MKNLEYSESSKVNNSCRYLQKFQNGFSSDLFNIRKIFNTEFSSYEFSIKTEFNQEKETTNLHKLLLLDITIFH